jgi:hypothetical protein
MRWSGPRTAAAASWRSVAAMPRDSSISACLDSSRTRRGLRASTVAGPVAGIRSAERADQALDSQHLSDQRAAAHSKVGQEVRLPSKGLVRRMRATKEAQSMSARVADVRQHPARGSCPGQATGQPAHKAHKGVES